MTEGRAQMQEFLARLREVVSPDVSVDWRLLEHSQLVYFEIQSENGRRGIELLFGDEECQLSIGRLVDLEVTLSRASDVARIQRIILGVMTKGLTVWKFRWRTSICVGTSDERNAQAHMKSRATPSVVTSWEPWVSPAVELTLVERFGDQQAVEWL